MMARVKYAAFISYSRTADRAIAIALRSALRSLAKPWYRLEAVSIFRDDSELSANSALDHSIEEALDASEFLILLASPESARSTYVAGEVAHFLGKRDASKILIVVTGGAIAWGQSPQGGFDRTNTNCLPEQLLNAYAQKPIWSDLRQVPKDTLPDKLIGDFTQAIKASDALTGFSGAVLPIAAALHHTRPGLLLDDHRRQLGRLRRLTRSAVAALCALTLLLTGTAIYARLQRNSYQEEQLRRTAASLTSMATDSRTDVSLAALLALHAYRLEPSISTVSAMVSLAQRNGPIARTFTADASGVSDLATDTTEGLAFIAGRDGGVSVWSLQRSELLGFHETDHAISRLAYDDEQDILAGIDRTGTTWLWARNDDGRLGEPERLDAPALTSDFAAVGFGFMSGGTRVFAVDSSANIVVWDITAGVIVSKTALMSYRGARGLDLADVAIRSGSPAGTSLVLGSSFLLVTDQSDVLMVDPDEATVALAVSKNELPAPATIAVIVSDTDSNLVVVGTSEGAVLYDRRRKDQIAYPLGGVTAAITSAASSHDGTVLAIGSAAGTVLVPIRNHSVVRDLISTGDPVPAPPALPRAEPLGRPAALLAFSGRTSAVAVAHGDGTVSLVDADNRRMAYQPVGGSAAMAFDPQGDLLLGDKTSGDGTVSVLRVIRAGTAKPVADYTAGDYQAWFKIVYQGWVYDSVAEFEMPAVSEGYRRSLALSAAATGDSWVAAAGELDGRRPVVLLWRSADRAPISILPSDVGAVDALGAADGLRVLVARTADAMVGWRMDGAEPLFTVAVGAGNGLSVSRHGSLAVTTITSNSSGCGSTLANRRSLAVVDLVSGTSCAYDVGPGLTAAAVSADAARIAVASANSLVIRNSKDMSVIHHLQLDLGSGQTHLAFSPDGTRLAASLSDGRVLIVDTGTGTLALPPLIDPLVRGGGEIAWSPDGQILAAQAVSQASGAHRAAVRTNLWRVGTLSWSTQMCGIAGRRLTVEEWKKYVPAETGLDYSPVCESFD